MKTINAFGKEIGIVKEFNSVICIWSTNGADIMNYEKHEIKLGQKIYNVKLLESDSIIYTLTADSNTYLVSFSQMFGFPNNGEVSEILKIQDIISKSQDRIADIYKNIERISYEPFFK